MLKHIIYILDENFDKDTIVNEKETLIVTNNSYGADYANVHNIPVIACETNEFLSQYAIENHNDLDLEYANIVYNRHHGNPVVIFETQRLIVREMRILDLPSFYEMYVPFLTAFCQLAACRVSSITVSRAGRLVSRHVWLETFR